MRQTQSLSSGMIFCLLITTGCAPQLIPATKIASVNPNQPTSVLLTSDYPLINVTLDNNVPPTVVDGGSAVAQTGPTPALGGSAPALAGGSPALGGTTPALGGSGTALSSGTIGDATTAYTITLDVTPTFSTTATTKGCSTSSPYSALNCTPLQFTMNSGLITVSSSLSVNVYDAIQGSSTYSKQSNALSTRTFDLEQIVLGDFVPFYSWNRVRSFTEFNNKLYFVGYNSFGWEKLYSMDTAESVTQVTNYSGVQNSTDEPYCGWTTTYGLFFTCGVSTDTLCRIDTSGTLSQAANTRPAARDFDYNACFEGTVFNDDLYFSAMNSNARFKTFKINSAGTVTQMTNTINNQNSDDYADFGNDWRVTAPATLSNELYFRSPNSNNQSKLYKIDTSDTITQISNTSGNQATSDNIGAIIAFNSLIYFTANNTSGVRKLFSASSSGTITQVSNTTGNQATTDAVSILNTTSNALYFAATNASGGTKLFSIGTTGTVSQLSNISGNQATTDGISNSNPFVVHGDELYFRATHSSGGTKLWKVTAAGAVSQVTNTRNDNTANDDIAYLYSTNGDLFFTARTQNSALKGFLMDSNGKIIQFTNTAQDQSQDDSPGYYTRFNGKLYFNSLNNSGDAGIYRLTY